MLPRLTAALIMGAWAAGQLLFPVYKHLWLGYVPVLVGLGIGTIIWRVRDSLSWWIARPDRARFVAGAMTVALLLRVAAAFSFPLAPANDHEMFYRLAASVVQGTGYGWGYGPSAFFAPGLPLLLAGWMAIVGVGFVQAKVFGLLLGLATVWGAFRFAEWAFDAGTGRWALLLAAASPTLIFYSVTVGYEPLLALVLLAWVVLTERIASGASMRDVIKVGVLMGIGALVKPIALLLPVVALVRWAPTLRARAVMPAVVATIVMLLVIAPWTFRNWLALGSPVLISTNGGVVLYAANNPASEGLAMGIAPLPGERDEVTRDRIRRDAALRWMLTHPLQWSRLAVAKIVYVWGTSSSIMSYVSYDRMPALSEDAAKAVLNVGWSALFLLCAAASLRSTAWQQPRLQTMALCLLYFFVLHLFFEALSRHHIAVLPMLCTIAAAGLWSTSTSVHRS